MKKHVPSKLSLATTTVRSLSDAQLTHLAGGGGSNNNCLVQSSTCYAKSTSTSGTTGN